jgi:hypothetical protein
LARKKAPRKRSKPSTCRTSAVLDQFSVADLDRWDQLSLAEQTFHDRVYYDLERQRAAHHDTLCRALRDIDPVSVQLDPPWCRVTDWTWNLTPLSPAGSLLGIGGRFNIGRQLDRARGQAFPCLYIAQDEATARAEKFGKPRNGSDGTLSTYDFALRRADAFVTFPLEGQVDLVLDLQDPKPLKKFVDIIKRFQLSPDTIRFGKEAGIAPPSLITTTRALHKWLLAAPAAWRAEPSSHGIPAPNQIFGYLAKEAGFEALLYPSQQGGRLCLAVFNENFATATTNSVIRVRGRPPAGATHIVLDRNNLCL